MQTDVSNGSRRKRNDAIDLLRGLVMALMALDHTRDFWANDAIRPTDLSRASTALFLTRWVTHFCAPVFVFLAGCSAALYQSSGRSRAETSRFLLTRGLWLIVLELTIIRLAWTFDPTWSFTMLQVIWALGWSMVCLAALLWLPRPVVLLLAIAMIVGHNAFDRSRTLMASSPPGWLRAVLHENRGFRLGHMRIYVAYPLVPWIGVMAAGYCFEPLLALPTRQRVQRIALLGLTLCVLFVVLRWSNRYGDASPWVHYPRLPTTILSFLNCTKYPPSLLYLLMTLGPALLALALFDSVQSRLAAPLITLGRVPQFFYIAHLYLIHGASVIVAIVRFGLRDPVQTMQRSWGLGYSLPVVYLIWLSAMVLLWFASRWFAGVKRRRTEWYWSYL